MSNGEPPSSRLADWLDPDQTGLESLQGTYYINIALADFMSDTTAVPVNGSLNFTDLSSGRPTGWKWEFEGGEPRRSDEQNPRGIRYASYGQYDVQLIITNEIGSDTLIRKDYIHVEPVISPNPSSSVFNVFLGNINTEEIESQVVNAQGVRVPFTMLRLGSDAIRIDLHGNTGSLYFLRLESPEHSSSGKLILIH
jgi:hypothetical protein